MIIRKNEDAIVYETNNPISKMLIKNFFANLKVILSSIQFGNIYEAGCGEGYVTEFIYKQYSNSNITAIDIDEKKIEIAIKKIGGGRVGFSKASIYETGQPDNSFDLVVSTEVLEHLDNPFDALEELLRISKKYIIISTPNEPFWRIANMVRLKYIKNFGNTPGHIQHWSKRSLSEFVSNVCNIKMIRSPFPWIMLLCEKKNSNIIQRKEKGQI
jgi:2-polyprenyl-3-methyl-5-hydroxy-6-metoxy-1,4-benzoquinol methylase